VRCQHAIRETPLKESSLWCEFLRSLRGICNKVTIVSINQTTLSDISFVQDDCMLSQDTGQFSTVIERDFYRQHAMVKEL